MRLGIDFGGTNLKFGLFNNLGEVTKFKEKKLTEFTSQGDLLENIIDYSKQFIGNNKISNGGFATKGIVDTKEGVILEDIGAGQLLAEKPLQTVFEKELEVPFIIENDARAYMLGEWRFGAGRGSTSMVCMTLGTGLGCSVITQNQPYYGSDALGGLLGGHISIDRNGLECTCGQKGCLELYCSATALNLRIKDSIEELNGHEDALPPFFHLVEKGDEQASVLFRAFIDDLSIGVVNVIHAFNPEIVVLGGGVLKSKDLILPPLTKIVHQRAWTYPRKTVQIKAAELGNKAAALGVAFHPVRDNSNQ